MDCPRCSKELLIDHVDENGKYFYVCMNPQCSEYRRAFNPSTDEKVDAKIKPKASNA